MIDTRNPADRIFSISDCVILCFQQAWICPSKPELDCIPLEVIPFTYSCKKNQVEMVKKLTSLLTRIQN